MPVPPVNHGNGFTGPLCELVAEAPDRRCGCGCRTPPGTAATAQRRERAGAVAKTPDSCASQWALCSPALRCNFVADWAVRGADDRILELSCGDVKFLVSGATRLS
jgi:hypothetical protein